MLALAAAALTFACGPQAEDSRSQSLGDGPSIGNCPVFPADNSWNRDVSQDPIDPRSDAYIAFIQNSGGGNHFDPGFSRDPAQGIPYVVVAGSEERVPVAFTRDGHSDPGPYPIPGDAPVEGGAGSHGDRHVIAVDQDNCMLYEMYAAYYGPAGWSAESGAVFDLRSNARRPEGWTSADAAGLPIFPGLIRYDEVVSAGGIRHALRFTAKVTQRAYVHPATHFASTVTDPQAPPMGLRIRLKQSFDTSGFPPLAQVILEALKRYGAFLADNGVSWSFQGAPHQSWSDEALEALLGVPGDAFEVVEHGELHR
jgi:hypothetical protein